jgi:hypothetical protein
MPHNAMKNNIAQIMTLGGGQIVGAWGFRLA